MNKADEKNLWVFREARKFGGLEKFILLILVVAGFLSILRFADWWFKEQHIRSVAFYIILSMPFWYGMIRWMLIWVNYLGVKKVQKQAAPPGLRVAIFTTSSPGEPLSMFEKTLEACSKISYPHTTYLLDDTQAPGFKEAAERYSALWLELVGIPGAKAGKINKALKMIDEDFIVVLDPDHIPFPNFLDEVLGYFNDEKVGFVQVSQAYYNQYRSFTAKGAAEQTYVFYGPTMMGLFGHSSSVAIGANCTFRKKALESIGGHGVGLAEDLVTSIRLHAAGWKSIFSPVIVSRGLVPEDFGSFCHQQMKWARGVYEVLFAELPRLFKKLNGWQRLSYLAIGTYYFVGVTSFLFVLIPFIFFWTGMMPTEMYFSEFLVHYIPVALIATVIYQYMQLWLCHPEVEAGFHWRGMILKFACWPVYFLAFLLAIVNAKIPYIPTAKNSVKGFTAFSRPLILQVLLFAISVAYVYYERMYVTDEAELVLTSERTWAMVAFASLSVFMVIGGIFASLEGIILKPENPWDSVDINKIRIR